MRDADTSIAFLDETGSNVLEVPPGFDVGSAHVITNDSVLELLDADCFSRTVAAFIAARRDGYARTVVEVVASSEIHSLEVFDLRDRWGRMVVALQATDDILEVAQEALEEVRPRWLRSRLDATGRTREISPAVEKLLGWTVEQYVDHASIDRLHPDDHDRALASYAELLSRPGGQTRTRQRVRHRDGSWVWFEITHTNLLHTDDPHIIAEALDISAEMEAQTALAEREELLGLLTDSLPVGILHLKPDGSPDIVNAAWKAMTGAGAAPDFDQFLDILVEAGPSLDAVRRATRGEGSSEQAVAFTDPDGEARHATLAVRPLPNQQPPHAVLLTLTDTSELQTMVRSDHLTQLLNRFGVEERLTAALQDWDRLTLIYCDLNNFKDVNDSMGHCAGDEVLVNLAERIQGELRSGDFVGRVGGDEFVVALRDVDEQEAQVIVNRIERAAIELRTMFDTEVPISAALGVTVAQPGDSFDAIVSRADANMYRHKLEGR